MTEKVLAIDGGGVRGLIPAIILKEIERCTGKKLHEIFDVIAGTSTGAVIALLATRVSGGSGPYSAEEIVDIYRIALPKFFTRRFGFGLFRPKYRSSPAERVLQEHMGDAELKDAATRVLVPVYALRDEVPRVVHFSSLAASEAGDENFRMWQVARGATAAPTYFSAFDVTSLDGSTTLCAIDGGVYANNPALQGWLHAYQEFDASLPLRLRRFVIRAQVDIADTLVVSLGTGRADDPIAHEKAARWGLLGWARPILDVVFEGQSDAADDLLENAVSGGVLTRHVRLQPALDEQIKLDDTKAIGELEAIAKQYLIDERARIERLCEELSKP